MRKQTMIFLMAALILGFGFSSVLSAAKPMSMNHGHGSKRKGLNIDSAQVDGFRVSHYLIDTRERMKASPHSGHGHMSMTHHLMVYIEDAHGRAIAGAKAGFLVKGPDGGKQKVMCVEMGGGYGADLNLKKPGTYLIKTKIVTNGKKLTLKFNHTVK